MAAPAYIAKGTASSTASGTSVTPTYMGSISANDLIIIAVLDVSISAPIAIGGYSLLKSTTYSTSPFNPAVRLSVFYKLATGSESGTVSITRTSNPANGNMIAQIYQYRGTSFVTIEDGQAGNGSVSTITWPAVSVGGTERTLIAFAGNHGANPGAPSGYSASASDSISTTYIEVNTKATVSSDGSVTATNGSSSGWCAVHVSIYNYIPPSAGSRSFIVN